jgi:hypothetical protein
MEDFVREKLLAKRWGISPRTLQRWRQDGRGPPYRKIGGGVFYRLTEAMVWEETERRVPQRPWRRRDEK